MQALVDHAPALAPDIDFHLLRSPARIEPLSRAANITEAEVRVGANSPAGMWLLPEFADMAHCDLFHAPSNILPARLSMKTLTTVHDVMWLTHPHWCDATALAPVKRRFFAHGIRRALSRSNRIATVSEATRDAILQLDPSLEPRVKVTRSGVSQRFKPEERDERALARLGLGPDDRFALVVGQFAPYKNHEAALRAFADALGDADDARLVLVQRQGPSASPLERLADELGIAGKVVFTGGISLEDLIQLYSAARLLVHPSLCEGFGNPLAEAMACGCPVVTSNLSAMPEVTGAAARLVDPRDVASISKGIEEVWHNEDLLGRMREAGLERTSQLGWREFAQANVDIYRELLAAG